MATDSRGAQHPELLARLRGFASLATELVMSKTMYGDTIVRLRRTGTMGLAAEMQWPLLPPLTFDCDAVTIAGELSRSTRSSATPLQDWLSRGACCASARRAATGAVLEHLVRASAL